MRNLIKEVIRRKDIKTYMVNFKEKHAERDYLPSSGYDLVFETYKVYSPKVVKTLYILQRYVKKYRMKDDYELLFALRENPVANRKYIKIALQYRRSFGEDIVEALNNSVYDTARKIQLIHLSSLERSNLIEHDAFFSQLKEG